MTLVIAIDGPAASGKGTLARRLAEHFNLAYLDTGSLYRAVGSKVMRIGADPADPTAAEIAARSLDSGEITGPELRTEAAGQAASKVAAIPEVREALLEFQRGFALNPPPGREGAVLDGRDIGTVVCPHADFKLFVTASVEARAKRRLLELKERGADVIESRVLQDLKDRDERDSARAVAPLVPAEDAIVLDTSEMDAEAVFHYAAQVIRGGRGPAGTA